MNRKNRVLKFKYQELTLHKPAAVYKAVSTKKHLRFSFFQSTFWVSKWHPIQHH